MKHLYLNFCLKLGQNLIFSKTGASSLSTVKLKNLNLSDFREILYEKSLFESDLKVKTTTLKKKSNEASLPPLTKIARYFIIRLRSNFI